MIETVSQSFPEKLKDILNEKYKNTRWFEPFELDTNPVFKDEKWCINTPMYGGFGVIGFTDGRIRVSTHVVDDWDDGIYNMLWPLYEPKIKGKSKEEKEKIWAIYDKEREEILNDVINRRWEKYLKGKYLRKPYYGFIVGAFWADEVARRVSEKFSVEVIYYTNPGYDSFFISFFDSKDMTEEQIINEVLKRTDAVSTAFKLYESRKQHDEEYKKFKKELLAKARKEQGE